MSTPQPPREAPTLSNDGATLALVTKMLLEEGGIALDPGSAYLLDSRLPPLAERLGVTPRQLAQLATTDAALRQELVVAFLNHETTFFRDWAPFEALRRYELPRLLAARGAGPVRVWSCACSTGQEPYSLAMLLDEHFDPASAARVQLLATDYCDRTLDRAREAVYSQAEINRGLPARTLVRYFRKDGTRWALDPAIRARVELRRLNLVRPWGDWPQADVVLLRNVLIYFDLPTRRDILRRLRTLLAPDGVLILGSSETTLLLDDAYEPYRLAETTLYRLAAPRVGAPFGSRT